MQVGLAPYKMIDNADAMSEFAEINNGVEWMCFDTEFIGEKRFVTLICLIQVATAEGNFLIDPMKLEDLTPLLDMLTDEKILKIVHAGDNDYRIFNTHFGIIPKNTFDTQIASAFAGYKYPVAFSKLVESELKVPISKGYTVTNWQQRPFSKKQISYALSDVIYSYELYSKLKGKLEKLGRLDWAFQELKTLEDPESYEQDPYKEAIKSNLIRSLRKREQFFLLRLLLWRAKVAEERDHSKEMVLPGKFIGSIVRAMHSGIDALKQNRRIPDKVANKYGQLFMQMYQQKPTDLEREVIGRIPPDNSDNPKQDILMEMLDLLVRYKCFEEGISHHMVMPRGVLKRMKNDKDFFDPSLASGWRREFLGEEIVNWFKYRRQLAIRFDGGKFELTMDEQTIQSS